MVERVHVLWKFCLQGKNISLLIHLLCALLTTKERKQEPLGCQLKRLQREQGKSGEWLDLVCCLAEIVLHTVATRSHTNSEIGRTEFAHRICRNDFLI